MIFRKVSGRGAFTLVELLLVIVLIAILMALVTLSGASMMESTNAQTEAQRLIRTVQALRSAWLACYADKQIMIGVTDGYGAANTPGDTEVLRLLTAYSDRSLSDEVNRYGKIEIRKTGDQRLYVGFDGSNDGTVWKNNKDGTLGTMIKILENEADGYGILQADLKSKKVLIRIK